MFENTETPTDVQVATISGLYETAVSAHEDAERFFATVECELDLARAGQGCQECHQPTSGSRIGNVLVPVCDKCLVQYVINQIGSIPLSRAIKAHDEASFETAMAQSEAAARAWEEMHTPFVQHLPQRDRNMRLTVKVEMVVVAEGPVEAGDSIGEVIRLHEFQNGGNILDWNMDVIPMVAESEGAAEAKAS